jgi:hypothetical protein
MTAFSAFLQQSMLQKHLDPSHLRTRAAIIRQEIYAPPGDYGINYLSNYV